MKKSQNANLKILYFSFTYSNIYYHHTHNSATESRDGRLGPYQIVYLIKGWTLAGENQKAKH